MISLTCLRTIPKIKPGQEQQEKLDTYLYGIERSIINSWRNHKRSVIIKCENDIMNGYELNEYINQKGYKTSLNTNYDMSLKADVPETIEIFFIENEM